VTHDLGERCRQIENLLAYPAVGPLSAAAIAVNLAASESAVQEALDALLHRSRVRRVGLDTFTVEPQAESAR
jgi:phosphoglycerate dehydrogenase-like enzyme